MDFFDVMILDWEDGKDVVNGGSDAVHGDVVWCALPCDVRQCTMC